MKATALSLLVLVHSLLIACGQGVGGPRDAEPQASGGTQGNAAGAANVAGSAAGSPISTSGSSPGGSAPAVGGGGGSPGPEPCGPAWMPGTNYVEGDIVAYQGGH